MFEGAIGDRLDQIRFSRSLAHLLIYELGQEMTFLTALSLTGSPRKAAMLISVFRGYSREDDLEVPCTLY